MATSKEYKDFILEQLDYIHDIEYWKNIISKSKYSEIISIHEMESNEECWNDWIKCDNEYSRNDKKAIDAGFIIIDIY